MVWSVAVTYVFLTRSLLILALSFFAGAGFSVESAAATLDESIAAASALGSSFGSSFDLVSVTFVVSMSCPLFFGSRRMSKFVLPFLYKSICANAASTMTESMRYSLSVRFALPMPTVTFSAPSLWPLFSVRSILSSETLPLTFEERMLLMFPLMVRFAERYPAKSL